MARRFVPLREIIKWSVLGLVTTLALLHSFGNKAVWAPLDAYCPFGSLESGWKLITEGGFLEKIQPSNLALLVALFVTTLLFGGVFCGWICPLGTLQDGLNWLGKKLRLPQIQVSSKWDRLLRWLRAPFLGLVLFESYLLVKLWFADYDPFRLLFSFHWLSEPEKILTSGWIILGSFLLLSLIWKRFWCRYLCPLGLVVQGLSKLSWFKIRWNKEECLECNICSKNCPVGITVTDSKLNSTACNNCLQCVSVCPKPKALQYQAKFAEGSYLAIMGVATFALLLITAQIAGWWNPKIGSDPAGIKGWMTLGYIAETYHITLDEIRADLQLPESISATTELRSMEGEIPDWSTELFREYVAQKIGATFTPGKVSQRTHSEINPAETNEADQERKSENPVGSKILPEKSAGPESLPDIEPQKALNSKTSRDPNEIKGSMTLTEVSAGWDIPLATLIETLGLPKDINPNVPIREYDAPYGVGRAKVKEAVQTFHGITNQ